MIYKSAMLGSLILGMGVSGKELTPGVRRRLGNTIVAKVAADANEEDLHFNGGCFCAESKTPTVEVLDETDDNEGGKEISMDLVSCSEAYKTCVDRTFCCTERLYDRQLSDKGHKTSSCNKKKAWWACHTCCMGIGNTARLIASGVATLLLIPVTVITGRLAAMSWGEEEHNFLWNAFEGEEMYNDAEGLNTTALDVYNVFTNDWRKENALTIKVDEVMDAKHAEAYKAVLDEAFDTSKATFTMREHHMFSKSTEFYIPYSKVSDADKEKLGLDGDHDFTSQVRAPNGHSFATIHEYTTKEGDKSEHHDVKLEVKFDRSVYDDYAEMDNTMVSIVAIGSFILIGVCFCVFVKTALKCRSQSQTSAGETNEQ